MKHESVYEKEARKITKKKNWKRKGENEMQEKIIAYRRTEADQLQQEQDEG